MGNCPVHLYPTAVCLEHPVRAFSGFSLAYTCTESLVDNVTMAIDADTEATVLPTDPKHIGKCGIIYCTLLHRPQPPNQWRPTH